MASHPIGHGALGLAPVGQAFGSQRWSLEVAGDGAAIGPELGTVVVVVVVELVVSGEAGLEGTFTPN
jgi:hypothetical protein